MRNFRFLLADPDGEYQGTKGAFWLRTPAAPEPAQDEAARPPSSAS